jgi:hypothetical protein
MSEQTYSPTRYLVTYWAQSQWIICVVDTKFSAQSKPFLCTDLRLATAAIEARLMEIKENDDKK